MMVSDNVTKWKALYFERKDLLGTPFMSGVVGVNECLAASIKD